jgi:hypothetical protein
MMMKGCEYSLRCMTHVVLVAEQDASWPPTTCTDMADVNLVLTCVTRVVHTKGKVARVFSLHQLMSATDTALSKRWQGCQATS